MRITALERLPRNTDRLRVRVDGEPALTLAAEVVRGAGLRVGDELDDTRLEALAREDAPYRAREKALRLLGARARSRHELSARLRRDGYDDAVVEATVAWLDARGWLDDAAFAASLARERVRLRPRGRRGILAELRRKGVDVAVAERAVDAALAAEGATEGDLAVEAAEAWARRNKRQLERADRDARLRARRRLYAHLGRRGFAPDAVRSAVTKVFDD